MSGLEVSNAREFTETPLKSPLGRLIAGRKVSPLSADLNTPLRPVVLPMMRLTKSQDAAIRLTPRRRIIIFFIVSALNLPAAAWHSRFDETAPRPRSRPGFFGPLQNWGWHKVRPAN